MLKQSLQQSLQQKLSPQQIQLMKLLQIPTIALEQRIKQEIEENPALEDTTDFDDEENEDTYGDDNDNDLNDNEDEEQDYRKDDDFDLNDYIDEDDTPDYKYQVNNRSKDDEDRTIPFVSTTSFHDVLYEQLGMQRLNEKQMQIGKVIIGNIDDSGYLQRETESMSDDFAFKMNMEVTQQEIEEILEIIKSFDPPGVGAQSLQECLLLQLRRRESENQGVVNAILILDEFFDEFTKKHYDKILKKGNLTEEDLKLAVEQILTLNPKPGNSLNETSKTNQYIIPDFTISNSDGFLEVKLNSKNTPELRVNRTYQEMLQTYQNKKLKNGSPQKDAVIFVKQKIDSARWFIDAIKQRQNTLEITMNAIMQFQKEYFLTGDETTIKPMILKDIAEIVSLDISTISRVANSKYVQTPFGTFLLKSFFSESLSTDSGEEVSTREVKKILQDCIEGESKKRPLTDDQLAKILRQKGYNIARRTIAKYREQLNIPVARLRKEL